MTAPVRLREVDGKSDQVAALLRYLQLTTLPGDEPLGTEAGWWWVAFEGDIPVAFAGLTLSLQDPENGYLCRAGVLPSHRGRGLQQRLLKARERKAKALGLKALTTDTYDNPHSSNNLISSGFRMFSPAVVYGLPGACYWRKPILTP